MRSARLAALVGALAALVLLLAAPAQAAGEAGDCREEPTPEMPGRGVTGWVVSAPDRLPPVGARFTRDGVPLYDAWGMAGTRWNNYDLGCGPDVTNAPEAIIGTTIANWALEVSKFGVGVTDALTRVAYQPNFLDVFNPLIGNAVSTLQDALFTKWGPVFLVLAAVILLWKATRLRMASALTVAAWAALVLFAATVIFQWPVKAGNYVDGAVGSTVGAVHSGINGTRGQDPASAATQSVYYAVLWQQWKAGVFGDADSAVARRYADDLFAAQALTWREARIVQADPDGRGEAIIEAKQQQFYDTANEIKDDDPDAYVYLTGKRPEARVGGAFVAGFAALCVLPLLFASALLILASYLIVRLAVMMFPALATVGIAYSFRGLVTGVASAVGAAVINSLAFAVGAAVNVLAIRILLSPDSRLPTWLALILAALFALVMWFALKPFRRLTKMASPNHNVLGETSDSIRRTGSKVGELAKTAAVAAASGGTAAAVVNAADDETEQPPEQQARRERAENYSAPDPAPAAGAPQSLAAGGPAAAGALPPGRSNTGAEATPGPAPVAPVPEPGPTGLPQAPHIHGAPPAAGALPGGPPQPVHTPDETPALAALPGAQPEVWPDQHTATGDPAVTNPDPGQPDAPAAADTADTGEQDGAKPVANTAPDDGGGVYYTPEGDTVATPESEPMMVEPEITDDGEQVVVLYNADDPTTPTIESAAEQQEDAQR